jgi:peroxin-2
VLMSQASIDGTGSVYVQRASQLEAERLDDEVLVLLLHQAHFIFRYFRAGLAENLTPELRLLLRGLFYANTVLTQTASPGRAIQNLRFCSEVKDEPLRRGVAWLGNAGVPLSLRQRFGLFALDVLVPYLWVRLRLLTPTLRNDPSTQWFVRAMPSIFRNRLWRARGACEIVYRALEFSNFLAFLLHGRYPKLSHRLTRTVMHYADIGATRTVSFEFVNRQLVWSGFAEFMVFLTPVLWSSRASRLINNALSTINLFGGAGDGSAETGLSASVGTDTLSSSTAREERSSCTHCGSNSPCMAHIALPCRHIHCYVCLALSMETDPGYKCKHCGTSVHALKRLSAT